jgi:hypothetical protein
VPARYRAGIMPITPVRPGISANHAASRADPAGTEGKNWHSVSVGLHAEHDCTRADAAKDDQIADAVARTLPTATVVEHQETAALLPPAHRDRVIEIQHAKKSVVAGLFNQKGPMSRH